jgi:hypothetical protein
MSYSSVIRWSGLAAMVAGVGLLIAELLELLTGFGDESFSELAQTVPFIFQQALYLLSLTLLLVGLVGLYARQLESAGPLGLVGFLVALLGTVLLAGFFWANVFIAPALARGAPEFLDLGGRFPGFFPSLLTYAVGWILFGLASLRARVYPRAAAILLIIGAALDPLGGLHLPFTGVLIDAAFIWLGFSLFSGRGASVEQPTRGA